VINTSISSFLFGGDPTVVTYGVSLLFEGIVSAVIVTYTNAILEKELSFRLN
jgi:Mn2+/Fe2+ NRAMP family transporter